MPTIRPHIIKRQILELQGLREKDAREMQDRMRTLFYQRLLPIIDKHLSSINASEETLRIDKLELDLGKIKLDHFELEITQQVEQAIKIQLEQFFPPNKKHDTKQKKTPIQSGNRNWELVNYFIQTGNLPWWNNASTSNPVLESLNFLIEKESRLLVQAISRWANNENYLRRLVSELPSEILLSLVELQLKHSQIVKDFISISKPLSSTLKIAPSHFEKEVWLKLFQIVFIQKEEKGDAVYFWQNWLLQLSVVFQVKYKQLLNTLQKIVLENQPSIKTDLSAIIQKLLKTGSEKIESGDQPDNQLLLQSLLTLVKSDNHFSEEEAGALNNSLRHLHRGFLSNASLELLSEALAQNEELRQALVEQWISSIDELLNVETLTSNLKHQLNIFAKKLRSGNWKFSQIPDLLKLLSEAQQSKTDSGILKKQSKAFDKSNELFIENAGLVILWSFLPRFFQSLGLVENYSFVDIKAKHRAAGLLQYLADGQLEAPEYLQGFNKILCGLAWDEVLDFGVPISEDEIKECEILLKAVIANAPILKDMTPDGFRGSFLLRKGMLRPIPEGWELLVEKETYDIVLKQFPWSWKVVKLSWLEQVILVEW